MPRPRAERLVPHLLPLEIEDAVKAYFADRGGSFCAFQRLAIKSSASVLYQHPAGSNRFWTDAVELPFERYASDQDGARMDDELYDALVKKIEARIGPGAKPAPKDTPLELVTTEELLQELRVRKTFRGIVLHQNGEFKGKISRAWSWFSTLDLDKAKVAEILTEIIPQILSEGGEVS